MSEEYEKIGKWVVWFLQGIVAGWIVILLALGITGALVAVGFVVLP